MRLVSSRFQISVWFFPLLWDYRKCSLRGGSPREHWGFNPKTFLGLVRRKDSPGYLETSYYPHPHLRLLVPKGKTLMACTHLHSWAETQAGGGTVPQGPCVLGK